MTNDIRLLKMQILLMEAGIDKDDAEDLAKELAEIAEMQLQPITYPCYPVYPTYPTYPTYPNPNTQPDVWYTTSTRKADGSIH